MFVDPEIEEMLEPYRQQVTAEGDKPIAKTAVRLNDDCRALECNFGTFISNANLLKHYQNIIK